MTIRNVVLAICFSFAMLGCEIPQVMRPLRLYDVSDGSTIEVFLQRNSPNSGKLISARVRDEKFEGEIVLYGNSTEYRPFRDMNQFGSTKSAPEPVPSDDNFAGAYGFGKDANARPAGTAILVGSHGTTIEIVLYRISPDLQYGDGIARDNKGHRYRVFLSVES